MNFGYNCPSAKRIGTGLKISCEEIGILPLS
jgi:hypothetical protein